MANLVGSIVNGEYTKTQASTEATKTTTASSSLTEASSGTQYDQEMFLQLLVAEMQYQDPLEPTSNTEYVAELASFTQIEAIQAVQSQMETIEANSLVGKYVILLDSGEYISGKVDYVYNDSGKLYLSVNDSLYDVSKLDSVVDEQYYNGVLAAQTFTDTVAMLPSEYALTLSDSDKVAEVRALYDAMDAYTKGFVKEDDIKILQTLENRIAALKKAEEE